MSQLDDAINHAKDTTSMAKFLKQQIEKLRLQECAPDPNNPDVFDTRQRNKIYTFNHPVCGPIRAIIPSSDEVWFYALDVYAWLFPDMTKKDYYNLKQTIRKCINNTNDMKVQTILGEYDNRPIDKLLINEYGAHSLAIYAADPEMAQAFIGWLCNSVLFDVAEIQQDMLRKQGCEDAYLIYKKKCIEAMQLALD